MTKLILMRHGESYLNREKVYFGFTDSPLTPSGEKQILDKIQNIPTYDLIFSSPLKRAFSSAKLVNKGNLKISTDDRLKELNFGIFENKTFDDIKSEFKDEFDKWNSTGIAYTFPKGESIYDLNKRVISFVEEIKNTNNTVLIVTHYGVINSILSHYITNDIENFWKFKCAHGTITVIEFHDDYPILTALSL